MTVKKASKSDVLLPKKPEKLYEMHDFLGKIEEISLPETDKEEIGWISTRDLKILEARWQAFVIQQQKEYGEVDEQIKRLLAELISYQKSERTKFLRDNPEISFAIAARLIRQRI